MWLIKTRETECDTHDPFYCNIGRFAQTIVFDGLLDDLINCKPMRTRKDRSEDESNAYK